MWKCCVKGYFMEMLMVLLMYSFISLVIWKYGEVLIGGIMLVIWMYGGDLIVSLNEYNMC